MTDMSHFLKASVSLVPTPAPEAAPAPAPAQRPTAATRLAHVDPLPSAPTPEPVAHASANPIPMPDLGVLGPLMKDERIHDILVSGTKPVHVDMDGVLHETQVRFASHDELWQVAERIMAAVGHQWSPDRPMIDTRLPDGSRVNIIAPPMAVDGISISIRKFPKIDITLDSMAASGQLSKEIAEFLKLCASSRLNIIVAGGTSSGKTTLLNALSAAISPRERVVTIEDSAELRLQQPHVVRLEAKAPTSLDAPHTAVTIRDLVRNALRMRPDRIVVGESRGPETFDILQAMNTGHDGSMTSLHANTPREAVGRLETMISLAMPQLSTRVVRQQIASTIHLLVQMTRTKEGARRITHITEVAGMEGETIVMQDLVTLTEPTSGGAAEYKWVAGAPRNTLVAEAARSLGLIRSLR